MFNVIFMQHNRINYKNQAPSQNTVRYRTVVVSKADKFSRKNSLKPLKINYGIPIAKIMPVN